MESKHCLKYNVWVNTGQVTRFRYNIKNFFCSLEIYFLFILFLFPEFLLFIHILLVTVYCIPAWCTKCYLYLFNINIYVIECKQFYVCKFFSWIKGGPLLSSSIWLNVNTVSGWISSEIKFVLFKNKHCTSYDTICTVHLRIWKNVTSK